MAATTPRKKPAPKRKAVDASDPGEFDFDSFAMGFQRPVYTAHVFRRADLVPRLTELDDAIAQVTVTLERSEVAEEDTDRGILEEIPAVRLRARLTELVNEFNQLAAEYDASKVTFTFRTPDGRQDHDKIRALMVADDVVQENPSTIDTPEGQAYADLVSMYSMSVICTSHQFTPAQWMAFRDAIGEVSYASIVSAYLEAVKGILPSAPFSPRDLPIPTPETSSLD